MIRSIPNVIYESEYNINGGTPFQIDDYSFGETIGIIGLGSPFVMELSYQSQAPKFYDAQKADLNHSVSTLSGISREREIQIFQLYKQKHELFQKLPYKCGDKVKILLEPGSVLLLSEDARYYWKYGIERKAVHQFKQQTIQREKSFTISFYHSLKEGKYPLFGPLDENFNGTISKLFV